MLTPANANFKVKKGQIKKNNMIKIFGNKKSYA